MYRDGSGVIILNDENEVLLIHRDNIPNISFPDYWDLPGGQIEGNESIEQTIRREMKEELGIDDLGDLKFYKSYQHNLGFTDNVFWTRLNLNLSEINLTEGQAIKYFSIDEIRKMKLAFEYEKLLEEFFREVLKYE
jgi:8-oxo-dGTP diphosphatase